MEKIAQQIRRQLKQQEAFRLIIQSLSSCQGLEERLSGVLQGLLGLIRIDAVEIAYPRSNGGSGWFSLKAERQELLKGEGFVRSPMVDPTKSSGPAARAISLASPMALDPDDSSGISNQNGHYQSSVIFPLIHKTIPLGLFTVHSKEPRAFDHCDIGILQQVGDLLALSLELETDRNRLQDEQELIRLISKATSIVSPASDPKRYLEELGKTLVKVFTLQEFRLFGVRREGDNLKLDEVPLESGADVWQADNPENLSSPLVEGRSLVHGEVTVLSGEETKPVSPLLKKIFQKTSFPAAIVLPLRVDGSLRWLLLAEGRRITIVGETTSRLALLLRNVAEQTLAGMTIYSKLRADLVRVTGLLGTAKVLAEIPPNGDVFQIVMGKIGEMIDFDGYTLHLLEGGGQTLVPVASSEQLPLKDDTSLHARCRELISKVMDSGKATMLKGGGAESQEPGTSNQHLMASPLLRGGRPFGAFCIWRGGREPFLREELKLLSILSGFTADAMKHSVHHQETITLRRSMELLEHHSSQGIISLDAEGKVTRASLEALRILDCSMGELSGHILFPRLFRGQWEAVKVEQSLAAGEEIRNFRTYARPDSDQPLPVEITAARMEEEKSGLMGTLLFLTDISSRLRLEHNLESAGKVDPLTGLNSQTTALSTLKIDLERASRQNRPLSLVLLKLEGLGRFNRKQGRIEGDRLLKSMGRIIQQRIRGRMDTAYRFGGTEFLVLLPETPRENAAAVLNRILEIAQEEYTNRIALRSAIVQNRITDSADTLLNRLFQEFDRPETSEEPVVELEPDPPEHMN